MTRTRKQSSILAKLRELNETQKSLLTDLQVYIDALELDRETLHTLEPVIKSVTSLYPPPESVVTTDTPDNDTATDGPKPQRGRKKKHEEPINEPPEPAPTPENGQETIEPDDPRQE